MSDPAGGPININWGQIPGYTAPKNKSAMTEEEYKKQIAEAQMQANLQEAQLREANAKAARFEADLKAGPQLRYNPIEETVGPDGKKTFSLRKELMMEGPEAFVQSERERLRTKQMLDKSDLQQQIAQQQAQQQGRLAQYGLKGGNRALMGRYSMRDALMAQQRQGRGFQEQTGELEARGMQLGRETQASNIAALGKAIAGVEQFELDKWKKQKEVEAAKASADATRDAGKSTSSCWVISELSKHVKIPRDQGKLLTKMKIHFAVNNLKLSVFYIRKCHTLIDKMNESNFNWVEFKWFNDSLVSLLRSGEYEAASALFKSTVLNLIKEFWPECSDRSYLKAIKEQEEKLEEMLSIKNKYEDTILDFECLSNLPEVSFEGEK